MKRFRVFAAFLAFLVAVSTVLSGFVPLPVRADAYGDFDLNRVVTLGADLTEEQKASILKFFGVSEDEVTIITITNQDEREHLGHLIPLEQIGTRTFSCAYVSPTFSNGIQVKTANMNYVTGNMIASTLSTSGVVNCDVLAAAPFEVSGTGALTGAMMAYESAVGVELDPAKKELANEELVTTNDLAREIGQDEATLVVNDIKLTIIRDGAGENEVEAIVDGVIADLNNAAMSGGGSGSDFTVSGDLRERLIELAKKVAAMKYDYDDVGVTLQRVAQNLTESTGIEDPIMDTFEDRVSSKVSEDSILKDSDDSALGLDSSETSSTFTDPAEAEEVSFEEEISGDGVSFTEAGKVDTDSWVDEASVLKIRGRNGYALMDAEGTLLTEDKYTSLYGACGYISAAVPNNSVNALGLLNAEGEEIVPFEYGVLRVPNQYWAVGMKLEETEDEEDYDAKDFDGGFYVITTADIYYLENEQAEKVAELSRDEFADYDAFGKCINIQNRETGEVNAYDSSFNVVKEGLRGTYDEPDGEYTGLVRVYRANSQDGLMGPDGSTVMKPSYYSISLDHDRDYIKVSTGTAEGLIDWDGNLMIPAEYDSILYTYYGVMTGHKRGRWNYSGNGYVAAIKDGEYVFLDVNGNVTSETGIKEVKEGTVENCGASVMIQEEDGSARILAADGEDTVLSDYSRVTPLYYGQGMLYKVQNDNYANGLVDWHGNVLFDTAYDRIELSADGTKLLVYEYSSGGRVYDVTLDGPVYEPKEREEEEPEETAQTAKTDYSVAGDGAVSIKKYGTLEGDLRWIYNTDLLTDGENILNVDGEVVAKADYDSLDGYKNAYITAGISQGDDGLTLYGVLSRSGKKLIDTEYERIEYLNSHWAVGYRLAETDDEEDYDYTAYLGSDSVRMIIDEAVIYRLEGEESKKVAALSREEYYSATAGSDYLIVADRNRGLTGYDADLEKHDVADAYSIPEWSRDKGYTTYRDNGLYGVMDGDGNIVVKAAYSSISLHPERNCAVVYNDDHYGLIDLQGNLLVPTKYDYIMSYSGAQVTDPEQSYSGYIAQGYVAVQNEDDEVGFCNVNGEETVAPSIPYSDAYVSGAAMVYKDEDDVQHILSADGVDTSDERWSYVAAMEYSDGLLFRCTDAKTYDYGIVDWHGEEILPPTDSRMGLSVDGRYLLVSEYGSGTTIYEVIYGGESSSASVTNEDGGKKEDTAPAAEEEPEEEPEEEKKEASADTEDLKAMIEEARALVSKNYRANREEAGTILEEALSASKEQGLTDVSDALDFAIMLIEMGSAGSYVLESIDLALDALE